MRNQVEKNQMEVREEKNWGPEFLSRTSSCDFSKDHKVNNLLNNFIDVNNLTKSDHKNYF